MKLAKCITLLLLMVAPVLTWGQVVRGKVSSNSNGETLIGVNIFNQDKVGVSSNVDGDYELKLPAGEHTLTFKFIGFEILNEKVTLKEGEELTLSPKLKLESTTLDIVVVTGSQYEKKISEEIVSVDVIQPYLIENTAAPDLISTIGKVPGVTVLDGQVSIRGGGGYSYGVGSRTQLVIDGLPLLSGDLQDIQWSAIPMETAEQIEVVKGSSSVLYGSGAINGVIHVRTGWATDKPETTFRIYQGVYSNPKEKSARWWNRNRNPLFTGGFFSHRRKIKNFDLVVGAYASSDKTYLYKGERQAGRFNVKLRYTSKKIKGLSLGISESMQFQQSGRFILWENNVAGAYKPLDGTASADKYVFLNVDPWIKYSSKKAGFHSLSGRYFRVERRNDKWEDPSVSNVIYLDYQFQNEFKYQFRLITGVQYQHVWSYSVLYRDEGTLITHNPAAFAQLEKKFLDRITVLGGVRGELNTSAVVDNKLIVPVIFRAGANFKVAKKTNIRLSYGQSFRFASLAEKYLTVALGPIEVRPNKDLNSEKGWSAELGVKQGFRISGWKGYADVALFWQEFNDMVQYSLGVDTTGAFFFSPSNVTKARVAGLEVGLQGYGKLGPIPVRLFLGYTFNYPADLENDTTQENFGIYMENLFTSISSPDSLDKLSILKYVSTSVFKADIEMDLWKFTLGFTTEYTSFIARIDAEFELLPGFTEYRELNDKGVWRMDARLGFKLSERSSFMLQARNFLNEFYSVRPGIMEPPRSFTLQYKLNI